MSSQYFYFDSGWRGVGTMEKVITALVIILARVNLGGNDGGKEKME